jgi:hypothetical protein
MKTRLLTAAIVLLVIAAVILATLSRDALYVDAAVFFFAICIAYANWCERL